MKNHETNNHSMYGTGMRHFEDGTKARYSDGSDKNKWWAIAGHAVRTEEYNGAERPGVLVFSSDGDYWLLSFHTPAQAIAELDELPEIGEWERNQVLPFLAQRGYHDLVQAEGPGSGERHFKSTEIADSIQGLMGKVMKAIASPGTTVLKGPELLDFRTTDGQFFLMKVVEGKWDPALLGGEWTVDHKGDGGTWWYRTVDGMTMSPGESMLTIYYKKPEEDEFRVILQLVGC